MHMRGDRVMATQHGQLIKQWRIEAGMSRDELAAATDFSLATIRSVEKGQRFIAKDDLTLYGQVLHISAAQQHELWEAWRQDNVARKRTPCATRADATASAPEPEAASDAGSEAVPPIPPLHAEAQRLSELVAPAHGVQHHPIVTAVHWVINGVVVLLLLAPLLFGDANPSQPPTVSLAQANVAGWIVARLWARGSLRAIGVIDPRTGEARPLWPTMAELDDPQASQGFTNFLGPTFAPATRQLAFIAYPASGPRLVMSVALQRGADGWPAVAGVPQVLFPLCAACQETLAWSPSGQWLLFTGSDGIYAFSMQTHLQQRLTWHAHDYWASCAPNGRWIAFQGPQLALVVLPSRDCLPLHTDLTGARYLNGVHYAWDPLWSPDSTTLTFVSNMRAGWRTYAVALAALAPDFSPAAASPYYPIGAAPCSDVAWARQATTNTPIFVLGCAFDPDTPQGRGGIIIMPTTRAPAWHATIDGGVRSWEHLGWIAPEALA
jgi:transcriptional regulator with XRE-family HTH domain